MMNIAKPLDQPDRVLSQSAADDLFSLSPRHFVNHWADALMLSGDELTNEDRENLVSAIQSGVSRLKIIDALSRHGSISAPSVCYPAASDVRRPPDRFAVIENFTRFSPDDDTAFIRYAFQHICDRAPTQNERLEFEFDLRRNLLDRPTTVKRIVGIARQEGHFALWDSLEADIPPNADESCARVMPAGLAYDENGRQTIIFIRQMPNRQGWMVAPDVMRQPLSTTERGWVVQEGWLIVGPKRSFAAGTWRVDVDLVQDADAVLDLDLVANSGLDTLFRMAISGSFCGSLLVELGSDHRFIELRLSVRNGDSWLNPRNVTMQKVS